MKYFKQLEFNNLLHTKIPDLSMYLELEKISCYNCNFENIDNLYNLSDTVKTIILSGCNIKSIDCLKLPKNLEVLCVNNNNIEQLDNLRTNLKVLLCSNNKIKFLDNLPPTLIKLECDYNLIKELNYLPYELKELKCSYNPIDSLDNLPNNLEKLISIGIKNINNTPTTLKYYINNSIPICMNNDVNSVSMLDINIY